MAEPDLALLQFLALPARPQGEHFRNNWRRPSRSPVDLSWIQDNRWVSSPARLVDIGKRGAALACLSSPEVGTLVRLRFVEGDGSPWIEATVLGSGRLNDRESRVRIEFEQPCPTSLLRLAVLTGPSNASDDCVPYSPWFESLEAAKRGEPAMG